MKITAKDRLKKYAMSTNPRYANGGEADPPTKKDRFAYTPEIGYDQAESGRVPTAPTNAVDQEVLAWTQDYINSPKYKERLGRFFKYPELVQQKRAKKAANVGFTEAEEGGSHYSDTSAFPNQLHIGQKQMRYNNYDRAELVAHELGHVTNANDNDAGLRLTAGEEKYIFDRNKTMTPEQRASLYKSGVEKSAINPNGTLSAYLGDGATHDIAPSENMSDIQALRFLMKKNKIYDAGTQDLTPELLKKAKSNPAIKKMFSSKRLFESFDDKDLIDIMNKVAKVETDLNSDKTMAAFGGVIKSKIMRKKFANGGTAGAGWNAAAQAIPAIGGLIETLVNKPAVYSTQPIMNAQTIHNMADPYDSPGLKMAFGGEMGDITDDQYFDWLEQMLFNTEEAEAEDEPLALEEETIQMGNEDDVNEEESLVNLGMDQFFATGGQAKKKGIHIDPSKKGTFTAAAKKHGKSVQGFASHVLANKSKFTPAMVKKANFAKNASKWKHAYGGYAQMFQAMRSPETIKKGKHFATGGNVPIEVEDQEIVELPNGQMQQMTGPTHEEGGISMTVPEGTKIFSDRLQVEGKSMQERKASRERRMAKMDKLIGKDPTDALVKNTYNRTIQQIKAEEEQDMALQKAANSIYQGQFAMGGKVKKYAFGDDGVDPVNPFLNMSDDELNALNGSFELGTAPVQGRNMYATPSASLQGKVPTLATTPISGNTPEDQYREAAGLTTGDYIGLGANVFGAIAPILNTRNAARANKPNLNRYIGVGREAIEANDLAQTLVGGAKANATRDLNTTTNSAVARAREGARGINTMRALNTATDLGRQRTEAQINQTANEQMINLLNQRGQLTNWRDQVQATGATARDERDAQDTDNYYSNMAENLANFATQAGNIGRNLNISKANQDNTGLLESMSEYFDFARDRKGKLVLKNKG